MLENRGFTKDVNEIVILIKLKLAFIFKIPNFIFWSRFEWNLKYFKAKED
jgi:hypothetical protein